MKKSLMLLVMMSMMAVTFAGCSDTEKVETDEKVLVQEDVGVSSEAEPETEATTDETEAVNVNTDEAELDLTTLSSTMVYSEVFNMMCEPEKYEGRKIKMDGMFAVYEDTVNNRNYYACIIQDATACCQQGIEFVLSEEKQYPADYPEIGSYLTVEGVFDTYEEDGMKYCQLIDSTMEY